MAKRQFKAESKRLLDLMINSIYTNKEIFLRELISNASDAEDKLYYKSLSEGITGLSRSDLSIRITPDKEAGTLTISDNGLGMTEEELNQNLGTICKSGSRLFKSETEEGDTAAEDIDIIGQFGVGFYSAFMVADKVEVVSKAYGEDIAHKWTSTGADGYTIAEAEKEGHGTDIILTLKADTEEENYSKYLEEYAIMGLVKKYSDYIRYPITMEVTDMEEVPAPEGAEDAAPTYEEVKRVQTLNTMAPIWKKNKNEVTEEEYNSFYMANFFDYNPPAKVIHSSTEGAATYNALLYIPSKAPMNYYSKDYVRGLKLYASGVLIMDSCEDLLPEWFNFVKGLVDSEDLSLNISREMLQQDRQLQFIAKNLEKKIKNELKKMLKNDREAYEAFWKEFGAQIKYGSYTDYGQHADLLKDLLLFYSSMTEGYTTLEEYVSRMKEDQQYIYYAAGTSAASIAALPQVELVADKGYEILYLTEPVDEFSLKMMRAFDGKEFRSVSDDDLGLESDADKDAVKAQEEENKELFDFMKESLGDKVVSVKASTRLKSHPVCISTEGGVSLEMEKIFAVQMNGGEKVTAQKVLEVNTDHAIFAKMKDAYAAGDKDKVAKYANILFNQAMLIEGLVIDNPAEFAELICELM